MRSNQNNCALMLTIDKKLIWICTNQTGCKYNNQTNICQYAYDAFLKMQNYLALECTNPEAIGEITDKLK